MITTILKVIGYYNQFIFDMDNFYSAKVNNKWGIIDVKENCLTQPIYETYISDIGIENSKIYRAEIRNKKGIININGNWLVPTIYDRINYFNINKDDSILNIEKVKLFKLPKD